MAAIRVGIIGGGAAGLAAAVSAARRGARVTILEHMDRVGKKILSTGNGRCNYTHRDIRGEHYFSGSRKAVEILLKRYPTERILEFFREIGVEPLERDGYYYPASGQASAVLDCLRAECGRLSVEIRCGVTVCEIRAEAGGFCVELRREGEAESCRFQRLILACGGKAAPFTGSDGSGYELARSLGHRIEPPFPALTGLKGDPKRFRSLAGIRVRAGLSLVVRGKTMGRDTGELQLTENGLSGIVVFQLSHQAVQAWERGMYPEIHINFLPGLTEQEASGLLKRRQELLSHKTLGEWGIGLFHRKLWCELLKEAGLKQEISVAALSSQECRRLHRIIVDFCVPVSGYLGFDRAQVTAGGVDMREIRPDTMESDRCPGLYLAGELLDVDGICGGYNLHWAWASGLAAGEAAVFESGGKGAKKGSL
ncbi:MAG: aminoacetone oxidase family FAD-binding enzyme [Lachnospiraceae bacterium]|nr:aminoacetone oxidase family FAD-binding enzyme [Lachnospiraceae bacterium]